MNGFLGLVLIGDVILQAIITNGFWLAIFVTIVALFRRELKSLFDSLASFSIPGGHFDFKDKKVTLQSYTILANIFVEMLLKRDSVEKLAGLISDSGARELSKFALKYAEEAKDESDVELLRNLVIVLRRRGRVQDAIRISDELFKLAPQDQDLLDVRGNTLFQSGVKAHLDDAERIYDELIKLYPSTRHLFFNRARAKSLLGKWQESFDNLEKAFSLGFWDKGPDVLESRELKLLREAKPEQFSEVKKKWRDRLEKHK